MARRRRFNAILALRRGVHLGIQVDERLQIVLVVAQPAAALLLFLFVLAFVDPPLQLFHALIDSDRVRFTQRHFDAAERRVVQRILRHDDVFFGRLAVGHLDFSFLPDVREVQSPGLLQPFEKQVRSAEQQNFRRGRIPARQRGEILINDGLKKGSDDFIDGDAGLEQRVGVGLRENPALAADLVQRVPRVMHFGKRFRSNLQFARRFLDEGAGAARAGALHQDLLALRRPVAVEEDGLHIFSTDFADETHRRMQPLDAGRHRHDFLNDFGAHDGAIRPAPEPVKNMRSRCGVKPCCASRRDRNCRTFSPCLVLCRS